MPFGFVAGWVDIGELVVMGVVVGIAVRGAGGVARFAAAAAAAA